MTTKRPRTTISFDDDEYAELQEWADSEYRTIPQLVLVFVKKALEERRATLAQNPPAGRTTTEEALFRASRFVDEPDMDNLVPSEDPHEVKPSSSRTKATKTTKTTATTKQTRGSKRSS